MKFQTIAIGLAAALVAAPALSATLIDATKPQLVLEIAKGYGSAELGKDAAGDPKITGRIDGTAYTIFFYGCVESKDCDDIQFSAVWDGGGRFSLDEMNEWNKTKRYGKAYLDDDRDPVIEMTVNVDHGVSKSNLDDSFNWWKIALKAFKKEVLKED